MSAVAEDQTGQRKPRFYAEFPVPYTYGLPEKFKTKADKGLLGLEVLRDPANGSAWVLMRWASMEEYEIHRKWLMKKLELKLETEPTDTGFIAEVWEPRKRLPLYGLIMGLVGLLGAFEVARARYGLFFGAADLEVSRISSQPVNLRINSPASVTFRAVNHSRVVTATLRRIEGELRSSAGTRGASSVQVKVAGKLGPIDPGGREKGEVQLGPVADPGAYKVSLRYEMKGGLFLPAEAGETEIPIRVWPELRTGSPLVHQATEADGDKRSRHVWVRVLLEAGGQFPSGVECSAELLHAPEVSFTGISSENLGIIESSRGTVDSAGAEVAYLEWQTSPLGPFETGMILLGVGSTEVREDWDEILSHLGVRCFRRGGRG